MRQLILFIFLSCITYSVFPQNYGLLQGLSYKYDYQKDIDNLRRQTQLDLQNQQLYETRLRAAIAEKKEKAHACANQIKELYPTLGKPPEQLNDGWYNVAVTNYYDMCGERKVYVYNITRNQFILSDELTELASKNLGMFQTDRKKKRLITFAKSGCCWHITKEYLVIPNYGLLKVHELEEDATDKEFVIVTTRDLINNEWISKKEKLKIEDYHKK